MEMESQLLNKLELALLLQLLVLVFAVWQDTYLRGEQRRILLMNTALVFSLLIQNCLESLCERHAGTNMLRTALAIYGYSVRPVVLLLFLKVVNEKKDRRLLWALTGLNAILYTSAFYSGICFRIDENNVFFRGPLNCACLILCAFLVMQLVMSSYETFHPHRKLEKTVPLLISALILAATAADMLSHSNEAVSWLNISLVSSCVFFYIWLHMQYAREHEQAMQTEQRIQIMISQIQPHFLYNTLSTIQALCRIDPEKAFETTEKFGSYLRMNIDSLSQASLIPFEKELEHTRTYADIEMMRFPYVHISYDIEDEDFEVPALSIQPIVENAIRHGVRGQYNGIVRVSTMLDEHDHVITVHDNGRGFDPASLGTQEGSHIGLQNVRERLEMLCGGSIAVESREREGCTVTIRIPRGEETT